MTVPTAVFCGPCQQSYPTLANVYRPPTQARTLETVCPTCGRMTSIELSGWQAERLTMVLRVAAAVEDELADETVADFAALLEMIQTPAEFVAMCQGDDL
jgi:hypothetical protein